MRGYTEKHQRDYMDFVESRMARRTGRAAAPEPERQEVSQQAVRNAQRTFGEGGFTTSWDSVSSLFTLVSSPTGYLYPSIGYAGGQLEQLLTASTWSWAAITGNAKALSQLAPVVEERTDGTWERAPDSHPLWDLIHDPLGADATLPYWPWSQLIYVTALHFYMIGNAYWIPTVVGGKVTALFPVLQPQCVTADESPMFHAPTQYRIGGSGVMSGPWAPDEIINIMSPSPDSFWKGSSALAAALRPIEIDAIASDRQRANLANKVAPGMIVSVEKGLGPTGPQRDAAKADLIAGYQATENDGLPWVIGGGVKVTPPFGANELAYFQTMDASRDKILATIGMSPPVAGVLDRAILNNFAVSNVTWWNTHLFPVLTQIVQSINSQLVRRYYGKDTRLWYDLTGTDVALQLLDARLEVALKLQTLGYSTNDINAELELQMPVRDYLNIPNQQFVVAGRLDEIQRLLDELQDGHLAPAARTDAPPEETEETEVEEETETQPAVKAV